MTFTLLVFLGSAVAANGPGYPTLAACWAEAPGVVEDVRAAEDRPDNPSLVSACADGALADRCGEQDYACLWAAAEASAARTASLPNGGL